MPAAPQQSQDSGGTAILWWIGGIGVIAFGIWYFAHAEIVSGYFYLKRAEIAGIQFFIPALGDEVKDLIELSPGSVVFSQLSTIARVIGEYLRVPFGIVLFLLAGVLFFRSSVGWYRQTYNMHSLLSMEVQNWPQEIPVLPLDLVKTDIDTGTWAMALTPIQFAEKYKLIDEDAVEYEKGAPVASLLQERTTSVFVMQLGPLWTKVEGLPPHAKALYAAFAARACRASDESRNFLNALSRSAAQGVIDFSGTDVLLKKYANQPSIVEQTSKHAYVLCVLASLLLLARSDGVLASADFLWLKPVDRRLWFMLNTVGRQTAYVEVAGPWAHWLAERRLKRRILSPMVEEATKALAVSFKETVYHHKVQS